jgi:metal-sulfur cluster biosynthetic enzyme
MTSRDDILDCLRMVPDPELGVNIVDLGMVEHIVEDHGRLTVELVLTSSGCPLSGTIASAVEACLRALPGVEAVRVDFRGDIVWDPSRLSENARRILFGESP